MASPDDRLINLLAALSVAVCDRIATAGSALVGHGPTAAAALIALDEFLTDASIRQLCDVVGLSHSGAVRLVDRLEVDGLVSRAPGTDGRSVAVVLTAAGRDRAVAVRHARQAAVAPLLEGMDDATRRALENAVAELVASETRRRLEGRDNGHPPSNGWLCRLCDFTACGRPHDNCPTAETVKEWVHDAL